MDKRIILDDYSNIFTTEEFKALKIFSIAGYDLIKRVDVGDLIVAKVIKQNEDGVIRKIVGEIIPEEWFEEIKPETEYFFEDIFSDN